MWTTECSETPEIASLLVIIIFDPSAGRYAYNLGAVTTAHLKQTQVNASYWCLRHSPLSLPIVKGTFNLPLPALWGRYPPFCQSGEVPFRRQTSCRENSSPITVRQPQNITLSSPRHAIHPSPRQPRRIALSIAILLRDTAKTIFFAALFPPFFSSP